MLLHSHKLTHRPDYECFLQFVFIKLVRMVESRTGNWDWEPEGAVGLGGFYFYVGISEL